jgi:hypothetical protein
MDPYTCSQKQAETMLDDILALPFNQEMRDHFQ